MIDRYNESPVGCIEDEYGEYVKHSDYAALELDKLELEQERDQLKQVNAKLEAENIEIQEQLELCEQALGAKATDNQRLRGFNKTMFDLIMDLRDQGAANFIRANGYTRIERVLRDKQALEKGDD